MREIRLDQVRIADHVNATCCEAFRSEPCSPSATTSRSCFRWSLEMIEWSRGVMPGLRKCYSYIACSQLSREQILQILQILAADQVSTAVTMEALLLPS